MGSGIAGIVCKSLKRNFIGIEKDEKMFNLAKNRIEIESEEFIKNKPEGFKFEL